MALLARAAGLAAGAVVALTAPGCGSSRAATENNPATVYVQNFQVAPESPQESQGSGGIRGLLRELRAHRSDSQLVGQLSGRVVRDLQARGIPAEQLTADARLPESGTLVRGLFHASEAPPSGGLGLREDFESRPVELTIFMDRLEDGTPAPLYTFAAEDSVHGVGTPVIPNPYAAAAKFVIKQVSLGQDVDKLAADIAQAVAERLR